MYRTNIRRLTTALGIALLSAIAGTAMGAGKSCVLIDTDFDIDDMMAIPMVIGNRHVAAVVTTEGATTAPLGGSALAHLLGAPGTAASVPVLIGEAPDPGRGYSPPAWLAAIRETMEKANGFLPVALPPQPGQEPLENAVARAVRDCARIDVLVLGPWTSFVRYSPRIAGRIGLVVAQGRPTHSAIEGTNLKTFNCAYDIQSCEKAFAQTAKMHPVWVDVPKKAQPPYAPTIEMVEGLRPDGLPGALKAALLAKQSTWRVDRLDEANGKSFLWDQLAGLYLLRPDLFHTVADHQEPAIPAQAIQAIWTGATNAH